MLKPITDAQRNGKFYMIFHKRWDWPAIGKYCEDEGEWLDDYETDIGQHPTHYWDFGLDTPLPPPPKGE